MVGKIMRKNFLRPMLEILAIFAVFIFQIEIQAQELKTSVSHDVVVDVPYITGADIQMDTESMVENEDSLNFRYKIENNQEGQLKVSFSLLGLIASDTSDASGQPRQYWIDEAAMSLETIQALEKGNLEIGTFSIDLPEKLKSSPEVVITYTISN